MAGSSAHPISRPGRCRDNAGAKRFFLTPSAEWIRHFDPAPREQSRLAIFDSVEGIHNPSRMPATLDFRSNNEYEKGTAAA